MSTAGGAAAAAYALIGRAHDWPVVLVLALSMPLTSLTWAAAARRWEFPSRAGHIVFAVGSLVAIGTVTGMVVADAGSSPLIALFFPLAAFIAVSAPLATTLGLLGVLIVCYLASAGSSDLASMLVRAVSLTGLAAMSMLQARAQRRARARLRDASMRDGLTGLPNRALFTDRLHQAIARAARHPERGVAVAFVDLDNFKSVNDALGHRAGDQLLRSVAPRLAAATRETDTLARFGGDEFVLLMEDLASDEEALTIAQRVLDALHEPVAAGGRLEHVRGSIGLVVAGPRYRAEPEALLRDADAAMYRAKARGGDRVEVFDEGTRRAILRRVRLERDLRRAVADPDQFFLAYQPIVDLRTGEVRRAESLLRWQHPQDGLVSAAAFVGVAEQTGMIVPIGERVLRAACEQTARWRATPALAGMRMSVNVSPAQIAAPHDLAGLVARTLGAAGLDGDALAVEITETMLIEAPTEAAATFDELAGLGVGLHLDDFGTGFSSLSAVRRFPLTAIKLDRSFVADLDDPRTVSVVRGVVELARGLGVATIAEGVETAEQLEQLVELGCGFGQGFLFSPAVDAAAFERLAAEGFGARVAGTARAPGAPGP
jgi:diguanylate cyclase (GGDEF)-like protein